MAAVMTKAATTTNRVTEQSDNGIKSVTFSPNIEDAAEYVSQYVPLYWQGQNVTLNFVGDRTALPADSTIRVTVEPTENWYAAIRSSGTMTYGEAPGAPLTVDVAKSSVTGSGMLAVFGKSVAAPVGGETVGITFKFPD